ncbi:10475_t:CDS:1, partial [Dentiscutata heterogama]
QGYKHRLCVVMLVKLNQCGEMISPFHQTPIGIGVTGVTGELVKL